MMKGCVFCTGMFWYMLWAKDKKKIQICNVIQTIHILILSFLKIQRKRDRVTLVLCNDIKLGNHNEKKLISYCSNTFGDYLTVIVYILNLIIRDCGFRK